MLDICDRQEHNISVLESERNLETVINSQLPQADDIDFRSLEYLFVPNDESSPVEPPWVDVVIEAKEDKSCQLLRLNARVQFLEQCLGETTTNLADAHMHVGYLRGLLEEREEQLKLLPDLRLRAAKNIAADVAREKLEGEVKRLEAENAEIKSHSLFRMEKSVKQLLSAEVSTRSVLILETLVFIAFLLIVTMLLRGL